MDNRQNKRTRSITGKLHRAYLFRKIRFYLAEDILIAVLLTIGAFLQQEYILTGSLVWNRSRWFRPNPDFTTDLERIIYTVAEENGTVVM
ncbi:MAG: hypothetical protein IJQ26_06575, partial [Lachnospiraceae bacterium]|nr:hypothetical protein [Lachnospiraceae bacterium]